MNKPLLEIENVNYSYDTQAQWQLKSISLEVFPGNLIGIVGPNGSGKSTLLKIAAGLLKPLSGKVTLTGKKIRQLHRREIAKTLGLPNKNYIPLSLEEKIVCHADNLIDNCKRQKIECEIEKALNKNQKEYAINLLKLHYELSKKCGIDLNDI